MDCPVPPSTATQHAVSVLGVRSTQRCHPPAPSASDSSPRSFRPSVRGARPASPVKFRTQSPSPRVPSLPPLSDQPTDRPTEYSLKVLPSHHHLPSHATQKICAATPQSTTSQTSLSLPSIRASALLIIVACTPLSLSRQPQHPSFSPTHIPCLASLKSPGTRQSRDPTAPSHFDGSLIISTLRHPGTSRSHAFIDDDKRLLARASSRLLVPDRPTSR